MGADIRGSGSLDKQTPVVSDVLRPSIVHDLGLTGTPVLRGQGIECGLGDTNDVLRFGRQQELAVDQVTAVSV